MRCHDYLPCLLIWPLISLFGFAHGRDITKESCDQEPLTSIFSRNKKQCFTADKECLSIKHERKTKDKQSVGGGYKDERNNGGIANTTSAGTIDNLYIYKRVMMGSRNDGNNEVEPEGNVDLGDAIGPLFQKVHLVLRRRDKEVGHEEVITVNGREMKIRQLSEMPPTFEILNFLSENETELIIDLAESKGMTPFKSLPTAVKFDDVITVQKFDEWDVNVDGKISFTEFRESSDVDSLMITKTDLNQLFNETGVDKDRNGFLTFDELRDGGMLGIRDFLVHREKKRSISRTQGVSEAWLWHDEDELLSYENLLEDYHERVEAITGIPKQLTEQCEPLQVQRREAGSFSPCQYDSPLVGKDTKCCVYGGKECQMCRYASLHIFLNDATEGGGLFFPLADEEDVFTSQDVKQMVVDRCEPLPDTASRGLSVPPVRGKAVLWYNHHISSHTGWMGPMDTQSIVGMTKVNETPHWTVRMWIDIIGDGVNELRPWRIGTNWLSQNNKNLQLIEAMRNDFFVEGEEYFHEIKDTYKKGSKEEGRRRKKKDENRYYEKIEHKPIQDKSTEKVSEESNVQTQLKQPAMPIPPTKMNQIGINNKLKNQPSKKKEFSSDYRKMDPEPGTSTLQSRFLQAALLLVQELSRDELETVARTLYDKLEYNCVPIIVNPLGSMPIR